MRNSRTACRNQSAPWLATAATPPRLATQAMPIRAAAPSSTDSAQRGSRLRRGADSPRCRCASPSKLANVSRHRLGAASDLATMARCRNRPNRSRKRAPSPASHSRNVSLQTPVSVATSPRPAPPSHADSAAKTTSTPVTLPGRASQGSTRSRCPHSSHRAIAMLSTRNAEAACSLRSTRTFVSRTLGDAQRAQRQPISNCDTNELARPSSYLLECIWST